MAAWINVIGGEWRRTWRSWWRDTASQILANIFHTLFVPLSFLLLARLSTARSNFKDFYVGSGQIDGVLLYFFSLYLLNSILLYLLLFLLSVAAFIHTLTGGRVNLIHLLLCRGNDSGDSCHHRLRLPRVLILSGLLLLAEISIEFNQPPLPPLSGYHRRSGCAGGWLFALGLYETMIYWLESVVKVVIKDEAIIALFDEDELMKKRRRRMVTAERIGSGLSFGGLWWWRLRDQVDYLRLAAEEEDGHSVVFRSVALFVSLGLYYLLLITGAIRCFAGVTGMMQLVIRRWTPIGRKQIPRPPWTAEETV